MRYINGQYYEEAVNWNDARVGAEDIPDTKRLNKAMDKFLAKHKSTSLPSKWKGGKKSRRRRRKQS